MDSIARMNAAMAYIETHLEETIGPEELTRIMLCSDYHFKRMFSFLAGL